MLCSSSMSRILVVATVVSHEIWQLERGWDAENPATQVEPQSCCLPDEPLTQPVPFEEDLAQAEKILERLPELGIDLDRVTQALEDEGIDKFIRPYEKLMKTLAGKRSAVLRGEAGQKT